MTKSAHWNQIDFNVLMMFCIPVLFMIWIYFAYATYMWNAKRKSCPEPVGGPQAESNSRAQWAWIWISSITVIILAIYGTVALVGDNGSGGGEGPSPVWNPPGTVQANTAALAGKASWQANGHDVLVVQVIAQQWKFTYRYPAFGGFETSQLVLPNDTQIVFDVTSLDVIHDFWAYQLSVKADANPGYNNVAYADTQQTGPFEVRCDELCGIWHGAMFNSGYVVSPTAFTTWATHTESLDAANTADLPAFAWTYTPSANGAPGGLYEGGNVTPYSPSEIYGAKQSAS
ncbi:MAG: hypothetical protein ACRDVC_07745 [Acidimicrobiales bacterium]